MDEFLKQGWLTTRLTWSHPISPQGDVYFLGSYEFGWRHASPSHYDRLESTLMLSLALYPADTWWIQPYVFCEGFLYPNDTDTQTDRRDFRVTPGISITWEPVEHVSVESGFVWLRNYSNNHERNFEVLMPGITLEASIGF